MAEINDLLVRIDATTEQLRRELARAEKATGDAVAKMDSKLSRVDQAFDRLGKMASKVRVAVDAFIAGFAIKEIVQFAKQSIDAADKALEMSQSFGVSVETLTGMRLALQTSGVSMEQFGRGLQNLSKWMVENGKAGKDVQEELFEFADLIAAMPDGAEKTAMALKRLGRSGADMIPFLNQGSAGLKEMLSASQRAGREWSTETAQAADEFNDKLAVMGEAAKGAADRLARFLLPALNDVADAIIRNLRLTELGEAQDEYNDSINDLAVATERYANARQRFGNGEWVTPGTRAEFITAARQLAAATEAYDKAVARLRELQGGGSKPTGTPTELLAPNVSPETTKAYFGLVDEMADYRIAATEKWKLAEIEAHDELLEAYNRDMSAREKVDQDRQERLEAQIEKALEDSTTYVENVNRMSEKALDQMTVFAEEAARNIQTALADFLFNPFEDGLEGMLMGFVDVLRRMAAEAAASSILSSLGGAMSGAGGFIGAVGTALGATGYAKGGAFRVGGSGGPDSQFVPLRLSPGELVSITPPGRAGGPTVNIVNNVDASGSDPARVAQAMKIAEDSAYVRMRDAITRGRL